MTRLVLPLAKAHVSTHNRKLASGKVVVVRAHEDRRKAAQLDLFTGRVIRVETPEPAVEHPTESDAFRRWFSGSKIIDSEGKPLVVYHGTAKDFTEFRTPEKVSPTSSGPGIWLTPSKNDPPAFHNMGGQGWKGEEFRWREGANVMPLYACIRNPLMLDNRTMLDWAREVFAGGSSEFPLLLLDEWVDALKAEGYDGIVFHDVKAADHNPGGHMIEAADEIIVFDPRQVKSAIGNDGSFDPNSNDLTKALGGGERWITVHPHGPDEKGQPVLIQPQPDGSAKVIGGAGGKLNHLRLTGVKPQGSYAETIQKRAEERKAVAKRQKERDKALGIQESKKAAQEKVVSAKRDAQRQYVKGVASVMGWEPADLAFDEAKTEGLAEHVANKLRERHLSDLVKRAKEAVNLNRERLLTDHSVRAETQLGEMPLETTAADKLSVQDIDPVSVTPSGLGFSPQYGDRAKSAGADVKEEAKAFSKGQTEGQRKAAENAGQTAVAVKEALELLRDPDSDGKLAPKLVDAKKTLDLLKLEKTRKLAERKASQARKEIAAADVVPEKAYVVEVEDTADIDAKVAEEVASDLRTIGTRAFLSEVAKHTADPVKDLAQHIGVGAFNSVNALALAAGGAALVDRSVVDVLGIGGAAQVLARRLATDMGPDEFKALQEGFEDFHLNHYAATSEEAVARAKELTERAGEIALGEAEHGDDLAALQEINQRRGEALAEANKTLGVALGEMEANAALVYALGRGKSDKPLEVPLGAVSVESAVRQARAIGLQRGDFTVESAGPQRVLKVTPGGLDRLADPVNREDMVQVRRNLDIIQGREDEADWMPDGITDRVDLGANIKPGAAPQLAEPFDPGADLEASIKAYIGGRAADGDSPADIVADLQSVPFMQKVGDRGEEYRAVIDRLAPLVGEDGKLRQAESLRDGFEAMADEHVSSRYGAERTPLHKQAFEEGEVANEALHRALSAEPSGVAAYKPIGELTPQDQGALREVFARKVAKESPETTAVRQDIERHTKAEPDKSIEDMFGEQAVNPEWSDWKSRGDQLREKLNAGTTTWSKYVEAMRGPERAYAAVQDIVRSDINKGFADAYNRLNPSKPLKVGRAAIRENLNHLDAVDPKAREARLASERELVDRLRNRQAGRYAAGSVTSKLDAAREEEAGLSAAQMGLFGGEAPAADHDEKPLAPDERHYLGHVAERQIAGLMPMVGANFRPGEPVKLFRPNMSDGKNVARQRAIKHVVANKRSVLSFGTGAGKTLIGLGSFTHLHSKGSVKRGLFLAPSIAQGGFQGEALKFLKPGAYNWHAKPGASREERLAAYKDPSHHFCVMTHQAYRDDMLHLGAKHAGVTEQEMAAQLGQMTRDGRKDWIKGVMRREGINFDYLNVDEGHDLLDRKGKASSNLAHVVDALGDHVPYYVNASADPVKNDVSEAFSLLQKMDPGRYTDQAAFLRRYGPNTAAAKDGLRRELARFQYPSKIDPDITATRSEIKVGLSDDQKTAMSELDSNVAKARIARMQGKVDVAALKAISPEAFDGVEDEEAVAKELSRTLGLAKSAAVRRLLEGHEGGSDLEAVSKFAGARRGKQGIVFAHSLKAVETIRARLAGEGFRVATISGKDTAKDKAKRIAEYKPVSGEPLHDIMVCSDAGAVGANLQSGRWLVNFDTPDTAKTHAQRNGRINRVGQQNDVELADLVRDHPDETRRRERLKRKYGLRDDLTSPMEGLDDTGLAGFLRRRSVAAESGGLL